LVLGRPSKPWIAITIAIMITIVGDASSTEDGSSKQRSTMLHTMLWAVDEMGVCYFNESNRITKNKDISLASIVHFDWLRSANHTSVSTKLRDFICAFHTISLAIRLTNPNERMKPSL
jgi:hypothetical protein